MNAFTRGKKGYKSIYVPTRAHGLVQRSCGTAVPSVVRGMKRMVNQLRDEQRWTVLDALYTKRVTLKEIYPSYVSNQLASLEARLSAANLSEHLEPWIKWVRANRQEDVRTADVYWQQVVTLIDPNRPFPFAPVAPDAPKHESTPFPASELTKARVVQWLTSRDKATSGTRRKYFYALKSFVRYLNDSGILALDPLAGLKAPKKDPARKRWVTADVDETIVANANPEYQAFFAFIKGTGCDVGAALRAQKGDLNLFAGKTDIRGTKTDRRAVHQATIEPWALPTIKALYKLLGAEDRHAILFPGLTRSGASHHHKRICAALNIDGYTLKDSRHSVAVRMRKAGKSFEEIAAQLGTSVYQTVQVYAAYKPDEQTQEHKEANG